MNEKTHGFSIRGIGLDKSADFENGLIFTYGDRGADVAGYQVLRDSMVSPLSWKGSRTDPQSSEISLPSGNATLHAISGTVTELLLSSQDSPPYQTVSSIAANDSAIQIDGTGGLGANLPVVIWIGDEAIRLVEYGGGGEYETNRGWWNTDPISHGEGAGVYTRPPFMKNRRVDFWSITPDGVLLDRGSGYLSSVEAGQSMTQLKAKFESVGQRLMGITVNREAQPKYGEGADFKVHTPYEVKEEGFMSHVFIKNIDSVVVKDESATGISGSAWYRPTVQYRDALLIEDGQIYRRHNLVERLPANPNKLETEEDDEPEVYEVMSVLSGSGKPTRAPWRSDDLPSDIPRDHPWTIAAALLFSSDEPKADPQTFDLLGGQWGLNAKWLFGDSGIQSFKDAIREAPTLRVDHYIAGWDGEPVDVLEECLDLIVGYGGYFAVADDGTLRLRQYQHPTQEDFNNAEVVNPVIGKEEPPRISWGAGYKQAKHAYKARVGDVPVGDTDGVPVHLFPLEASSRLRQWEESDALEYDYSFVNPDETGVVNSILIRVAEIWSQRLPKATIETPPKSDGSGYSVGDFVIPVMPEDSDNVFYNVDGTRLDTSSAEVKMLMLVLDVKWNPETDTHILRGPLTAYRKGLGTVRAPSGLIAGISSNPDGTAQVYLGADSSFGNADGDAGEFVVGQKVRINTPTLGQFDGTQYTIESVDSAGNIVTISPVPSTYPDFNQPLHTLRLDTYDDSINDRIHAYVSDPQGRLGSNNDPADYYT